MCMLSPKCKCSFVIYTFHNAFEPHGGAVVHTVGAAGRLWVHILVPATCVCVEFGVLTLYVCVVSSHSQKKNIHQAWLEESKLPKGLNSVFYDLYEEMMDGFMHYSISTQGGLNKKKNAVFVSFPPKQPQSYTAAICIAMTVKSKLNCQHPQMVGQCKPLLVRWAERRKAFHDKAWIL